MAAGLFHFRGESEDRLRPVERPAVFGQVAERYQQSIAVGERYPEGAMRVVNL